MVIGFSGLDGCGKSTLIKALTSFIKEEKKDKRDVKVIWTRVGYTPGINFLKDSARKFFSKKLPAPGRSSSRTKALKRPFVQRVWITIAVLELIWIFSVKLRFLSCRSILLLDRQVEDSLIDLKILFGREILEDSFYAFLVSILKRWSLEIKKVGIVIDLETSDYRCSVKFEPFPDLPEEKEKRIKLYEKVLDEENYSLVLDGTQEVADSLNLLKNQFFN